jgi:Stage II sporulation protein E (SpoIIE)
VKQEGLQGTSGGAIESAICVPLENDDSVIGVVNLSCDSSMPPFNDADMLAVKDMLPPVTAAIERALHANQSSLHTRQLEAASGLTGRTLLKPGSYEARNFELGYARIPSSHQGGAICERVPLANGGHVLMAAEPRADGADGLLSAAFLQGVFAASAAAEKSAASLATRLNAELCSRQPGKGETGTWIGQLSSSGQLSSCNASYAPPLWVPADDSPITVLNSNGPPLGGDARARWDEEQVRLLPGDLLVVASAGALGARNVTGQPFGPSRLIECVNEHRRQSLDTLTAGVLRAVTAWSGRPVPIDDLTVLAVRFTPGN